MPAEETTPSAAWKRPGIFMVTTASLPTIVCPNLPRMPARTRVANDSALPGPAPAIYGAARAAAQVGTQACRAQQLLNQYLGLDASEPEKRKKVAKALPVVTRQCEARPPVAPPALPPSAPPGASAPASALPEEIVAEPTGLGAGRL